ncbi:hypothetical protein SCARR_02251 [Pontiella sulfatireligans]|uniref:Uncharacterized protein n=1 Tax=Pontiella sulfatireligans TaxID=2750658 RepID=A0A6C2UJ00_9BACT|nr:hypothetical protein SCARR_02251 [Pontiella sulfatireligans]
MRARKFTPVLTATALLFSFSIAPQPWGRSIASQQPVIFDMVWNLYPDEGFLMGSSAYAAGASGFCLITVQPNEQLSRLGGGKAS